MASSKSKICAGESYEEPPTAKFSKKTKSSKHRKKWNSYEMSELINLLEERSFLWDVFHKNYTKRKIIENLYSHVEHFVVNIDNIKTKINGVRAQLSR